MNRKRILSIIALVASGLGVLYYCYLAFDTFKGMFSHDSVALTPPRIAATGAALPQAEEPLPYQLV